LDAKPKGKMHVLARDLCAVDAELIMLPGIIKHFKSRKMYILLKSKG